MAEKNRRLKRLRERLEKTEQELAGLKDERARVRSAQHAPDLSYESAPVFFLVGRAKSGTSWLMRILNAHPEILCKGEGRFFGRDFKREDLREEENGRIQPASLYRTFLEADYLRAWIERSVWTRGDDVEEHVTNLTRLATHYFLTQKLAGGSAKIVGDKTPFLSADILKEIGEIYPETRVIHIIRDGRDVAVSLNYHRWNHTGIYRLDPEEIKKREAKNLGGSDGSGESLFTEKMLRSMAAGWKAQIGKARQDGQALLGSNYTEVKYEDLLTSPEEEVKRLLKFLEVGAEDQTVRECVSSASFESWTNGRQRGQEDPSSFFRKGVAGDWRNFFTEKDRDIFKEEAGDLLVELGYEEDNDW